MNEVAKFDDYLRYGTDEERSKGDSSRRAYCWTLKRFLRFIEGETATPDLARKFIRHLERSNSPSSVNRHIWALKSYFRFKGDKFNIRGLATDHHYPRYLRDEEWDKLLRTAMRPIYDADFPDYARERAKLELALLYAYCGAGLRCSEAMQLRRDDIIDEGYLRVMRKGRREDYVPVEDTVLKAFQDYLSGRANGEYVFPGKVQGNHMASRTAQGIIKDLCRRAGLPDVHIHSLRHSAGYKLRKLGASERDIQDFLGHKNISTTKLYTHLTREDLRERLPKRFKE